MSTTDTLDAFIALADEAGLYGSPLNELSLDAERALAILRYALEHDSVTNVPAFTVARFRDGFDPRTSPSSSARSVRQRIEAAREAIPDDAACPTLEQIEHAWSVDAEPVLELMAAVISRAGGFANVER